MQGRVIAGEQFLMQRADHSDHDHDIVLLLLSVEIRLPPTLKPRI